MTESMNLKRVNPALSPEQSGVRAPRLHKLPLLQNFSATVLEDRPIIRSLRDDRGLESALA